ncbi:MAG: PAS domain S-box protein, partial [Ilumatobacteraceae bacterium]
MHRHEAAVMSAGAILTALALATAAGLVVLLVVGRWRDVKARERALAEANSCLAAENQRLDTLLAHTDDAVAVVSDEGTVVWTSPSFTRLLGWQAPIERVDAPHHVHPDDRASLFAAVADLRQRRRPFALLDVRVRHRDGRYLVTRQLLSDCRADPAVNGIVVTFRDVTDHRRV